MNERSIFMQALDLDDPREQDEYLRQVCGDDESLRVRVARLLQSHRSVGSFLLDRGDIGAVGLTVDVPPLTEQPGTVVGPYKLMEQIGEGGMGVVYMAEQVEPVRRRVALKVIKPGMDSRQVIARFDAERQALAMMDHPNIAKVHDAGMTPSGRPYFVMELVRGLPITEYCDREQLAIPDRLELFTLVCRAAQHAHQKGIIHRDLKPSNVLVTVIDGVAVPKVIDFGVAKATDGQLTDKTLFTGFHQMVGTPLYMSPEQADLSGVDVDTRSDIYSLGVLLYELLTGTTPFDSETLKRAAFEEMRRIIREEEPPKPSTRLGTLGATAATVSANRKADVRRLDRSVRGELDWIVMKALEKDRRRRYETANDFAADVMRYLTDRPVEACPPSLRYRVGKIVRRNRLALTTTVLVAGALIAGTAVSVWQASYARMAAAEAARNAEESQQVIDYLAKDIFGALRPAKGRGRSMTVGELLNQTDATISERFRGQPRVEASVRIVLARSYSIRVDMERAVGHAARAAELRAQYLGPNHPATLEALTEEAEALCVQGWSWPGNPGYAEAARAARAAEAAARRVLVASRRVLGPAHPDTIKSQTILALSISHLGRQEEAAELATQALQLATRALRPDHDSIKAAQSALAWAFMRSGDLARAEVLFRELLASQERTHGPLDYFTINTLKDLANTVRQAGRTDEARQLYVEAIARSGQTVGLSHIQVSGPLSMLRELLLAKGDHLIYRDLWERWIRELLADPQEIDPYLRSRRSVCLSRLALDLMRLPEQIHFDPDLIVRAVQEAVQLDGDWDDSWTILAVVYYRLGRLDDAMRAIETSMARPNWKGGDDFDWLVLALIHARRGNLPEARAWYDKARSRKDPVDFNSDYVKPLRDEAAALLGVE